VFCILVLAVFAAMDTGIISMAQMVSQSEAVVEITFTVLGVVLLSGVTVLALKGMNNDE